MVSAPLVSCVLIAYNYEKYVGRAVDSILAQTGFDPGEIEIIAVDDGSTDGTPDILAGYGERVRVIRQKNQGPTVAMAAGIAAARGRYIAFLDADDEWMPERLQATVAHLEANPNVGLVHSNMSIIDGEGKLLQATYMNLPSGKVQTGNILGRLLINNHVSTSAITVRAELARAAPKAPAWAWCRDWWLATQIAVDHAITLLPEPLVRYRSHGDNYNGLIQRPPEKTRKLLERDVLVRRLLLTTVKLSGVAAGHLVQAVANQQQTLNKLARMGTDIRALIKVTPAESKQSREIVAKASRLLDKQFDEAVRLATRAIAIDPFNGPAVRFFETLKPPRTPNAQAAPANPAPEIAAARQQLLGAIPKLASLRSWDNVHPLQAQAVWKYLQALGKPPRVLELGLGAWAAPLAVMTQALGGNFYCLGLQEASAHALVDDLRRAESVHSLTVGVTRHVETNLNGEAGQFLDLGELGDAADFDLIWVNAANVFGNAPQATHALPSAGHLLAMPRSRFMLETGNLALQRYAASTWRELLALEGDGVQFAENGWQGAGLLVTLDLHADPAGVSAPGPSETLLLQCHREGLDRVIKVIDETPGHYDYYSMNLVDPKFANHFGNDISLEDKKNRALRENLVRFSPQTLAVIRGIGPGPAAFANTANNVRELVFTDTLLANENFRLEQHNLFSYPTAKSELPPEQAQRCIDLLLRDVAVFYESRTSIDPVVVSYQILYTHSFLTFLLSLRQPGAGLPSLMALPNDHSPAPVAMSLVMKAHGVPRLYLQHAEVIRAFPPLDFEFSVLRNRRSLRIYEEIGPVSGRVFILPRELQPFNAGGLAQDRGAETSVVIYPNNGPAVEPLRKVIEQLQANPGVREIFLKPHPANRLPFANLLAGLNVKIVSQAPATPHVALVGNSGVVAELLNQGVAVYQNFDFDIAAPDLHGFVLAGITRQVAMDELRQRFWTPYVLDAKWLESYGDLNPAVDVAANESNLLEFRRAMQPFFMQP